MGSVLTSPLFLNFYLLIPLFLQELFICPILLPRHLNNQVLCRYLERIFANRATLYLR